MSKNYITGPNEITFSMFMNSRYRCEYENSWRHKANYLARIIVVIVDSTLCFLTLAVSITHLQISLRCTTPSFPALPNKSPSLYQLFSFVTKLSAHVIAYVGNFRNHRRVATSTSHRRSLCSYLPIDGSGKQSRSVALWCSYRIAFEACETGSRHLLPVPVACCDWWR